jgi:hypothetical protein
MLAVAVPAATLGLASASGGSPGLPERVSFARDVQPIFDRSCTTCHPVAYPYLDLRSGRSYDALVHVPAATNPAFARVLPGRPELSYLLVHPPDPSNANLLGEAEIAILRRWIQQGAPES